MNLVREMDLGKKVDKITEKLKEPHREVYRIVSGDVWNILMDKAENEAYDKIKMVHKREGITNYGSLYRWLTDVSGLGLAE